MAFAKLWNRKVGSGADNGVRSVPIATVQCAIKFSVPHSVHCPSLVWLLSRICQVWVLSIKRIFDCFTYRRNLNPFDSPGHDWVISQWKSWDGYADGLWSAQPFKKCLEYWLGRDSRNVSNVGLAEIGCDRCKSRKVMLPWCYANVIYRTNMGSCFTILLPVFHSQLSLQELLLWERPTSPVVSGAKTEVLWAEHIYETFLLN